MPHSSSTLLTRPSVQAKGGEAYDFTKTLTPLESRMKSLESAQAVCRLPRHVAVAE